MPLTRFVADALGVVTICLVAISILLGLLCVVYMFYFRSQIHSHSLDQLSYFNGPWIIRIAYIFFSIWWGIGEIVRLNLFRRKGGPLDALSLQWQENICKCYIVSNLGFAEPCLFLTLVFLLRTSLQRCGPLTEKRNVRTTGYVLLYCLPTLVFQIMVISIGPYYKNKHLPELPLYFVEAAADTKARNAICTYPLLSTLFLGLFSVVLTVYLFWLGARVLRLVINRGLQRRVYALIVSTSGIFPLRVVLLGLSVLFKPERAAFNATVFLAFFCFLCCAGVGICILVYLPIADSLALRNFPNGGDVEAAGDSSSLIANRSPGESTAISSRSSPNRGSISFRVTKGKEYESGPAFVELGLFNPSENSPASGSPPPRGVGWPMIKRSHAEDEEQSGRACACKL
ncbi:uncharacterized protein LOC127261142 [Andrographis paniculata]|uniref:uncharacterized protein LOC127261142 n=1 Tax=Andrographis paniculata TaxID=175694 RepID=UPI0021E90E02|nr:uncharacterized protein LOC127261142 [Andrographis paniculata]XP_051145311.1 uncharacterized protein LOC127261142 [Andrographis paniculata]XP_051145312.1 uncharacterized protein LOC127261142 [Andrographis paniculata]XP_051145313.1 uncharacterized protein LOC127261142 [Andrographis paniculata]XP_051145315.1 uncharacterized protein LOC127261142 [Andrographis paniculata]